MPPNTGLVKLWSTHEKEYYMQILKAMFVDEYLLMWKIFMKE